MSSAKAEVIQPYKLHEKDTGSTPVQIALLTERITHLTNHLATHKKDFSTRRSLLKLAGQRRRLMRYLQKKNSETYNTIIAALKIRG